ncbi:DUF6122 family protein [Mesonia aquimarina]|uniref:DUF6122 family protein n=1 Tax=Mesonia aquimarina TaxID=1504967 RepID=UPI000EF630AD|nr:DUF6122 family protein [Mesonia aquimarina]
MLQPLVHYGLHFGAIVLIAYFYDAKKWKFYWFILALTMLIDLDHLWATPIFEPNRCSINFHFLHTYIAWFFYVIGAVFIRHKLLKIIFIGLNFHLLTDSIDCLWNWYG